MGTEVLRSNFIGQVCTRCLMDQSDPLVTFSEEGVCSHCLNYNEIVRPQILKMQAGHSGAREEMVAQIRGWRKGAYDCAIGVSGGVDSSYLLHLAKVELGLNPLVIHVDAGWNSEIAVRNIENLVKKLKLDLHTEVIDWNEMRDLQLAFLQASVPNQDIPQDMAYMAILHQIPAKMGIKHVLVGSNLATECILPKAWVFNALDGRHVRSIHKKFGRVKLKTFPIVNLLDVKIFYPKIYGQKKWAPLNFFPYNKSQAMQFLIDEYGWRYYGGKHYESSWTEFYQSYYLPKKFGWDKRKPHLSSLIVSGQITRDEALAEFHKPIYEDRRVQELKSFVANKLGITPSGLEAFMALPNKRHEDYPSDQYLVTMKRKILNFLGKSKKPMEEYRLKHS